MPSQTQTKTPIALPIPRRRSPLLNSPSLGQDLDLSLCLLNTHTKAKNQGSYNTFISRDMDVEVDEYSPPAAPPPSPVNFPGESWSTALRR